MKVSCIAKAPVKPRRYSQGLFDGVGPAHRTCAQCAYFRSGVGVKTTTSAFDNGRCRGMRLQWQDDAGCSDVFTFGRHDACPLFQPGSVEYSDDA